MLVLQSVRMYYMKLGILMVILMLHLPNTLLLNTVTYIHAHIHIHTHPHTRMHTHACTHVPPPPPPPHTHTHTNTRRCTCFRTHSQGIMPSDSRLNNFLQILLKNLSSKEYFLKNKIGQFQPFLLV